MALSEDAIFDRDRRRTDAGPADHDEPTFHFYDRCANPVIGSIRDVLEGWFAEYPPGKDRNDLLGRLRKRDRQSWNGASWELYIHASLRRFGFEVTPHPALVGSRSRPDFLAVRGEQHVYVECVTLGRPPDHVARINGIAKLEAALDASGVADCWLALEIDRFGATPVPQGRFVRAFKAWLTAQDPELLARHNGVVDHAFTWDREGWRVRVVPILRGSEMVGRADVRPLGVMPGDEDDRITWVVVRDLLEAKASAYGRLGAPFVIALGAPDVWPDNPELEWAVFGPHPFTKAWERSGFFLGHAGREHVSAVVLASAVQPHTAASRLPTLYQNPRATREAPASLRWPRVRIEGDEPKHMPGVQPHALFGLPRDWPPLPWD